MSSDTQLQRAINYDPVCSNEDDDLPVTVSQQQEQPGSVCSCFTERLSRVWSSVGDALSLAPRQLLTDISHVGDERDYARRFVQGGVLGEGEFGQVRLVVEDNENGTASYASKILEKGIVFKYNIMHMPCKVCRCFRCKRAIRMCDAWDESIVSLNLITFVHSFHHGTPVSCPKR